ncbi:MAG TPA: ATP-binding protein [Methanomassiliicoccales archaeon]|nr:ATP-binding protein [Methanomassiliicoccales archaeon]
MLLEFEVENFRSFADPVSFSMIASSDRSHADHLIAVEGSRDRLMRSASIYGANASGKSNLVMAMGMLQTLVLRSHLAQFGEPMPFFPFKFGKPGELISTHYRAVFLADGVEYEYSLRHDAARVLEESLYHFPKNRKAIIFERAEGRELRAPQDDGTLRAIAEKTLPNALLLSKAVQDNHASAIPAFKWFQERLMVILNINSMVVEERALARMQQDERFRTQLLKALQMADLGIVDVRGKVVRMDQDELDKIPPEIQEQMKGMVNGRIEQWRRLEIKTVHQVVDEDGTAVQSEMDFHAEESLGTQKVLAVVALILEAVEAGKLLVLDEMDLRLHPLIARFLVEVMNDPEQNRLNAQFVFTTHNTGLFDLDLFRRDQIWFVEKDARGRSVLYSLSDFKVRKDLRVQKAYEVGRFGAIPFVRGGKVVE